MSQVPHWPSLRAALVAVHAAEHVVAATACGLKVPVVAVGFGPVLSYVII